MGGRVEVGITVGVTGVGVMVAVGGGKVGGSGVTVSGTGVGV